MIFTLPFIIWGYAFRSFYSAAKGLLIMADARLAFTFLNHYLNQVLRGVYPFWNPFNAWGRPDDHVVRNFAELNPAWYLIPFLKQCGLPTSLAFFVCWVGFFFLGVIGFYFCARLVLKDKLYAYAAMILLLFSGLGTNLFNDILVILIFVPGVWFFYFLLVFTRTFRPQAFVGLTFTAMLLAITYIPFIFATVFLTFAASFVFLCSAQTACLARRFSGFFRARKWLVVICCLSLVFAALPGYFYSQAARSGDYIATWRDSGGLNADIIELSLENAQRGGAIIGSLSLRRLFSELDTIPHLGFIYVPIFWFLLATLGLIAPIRKRTLFLFSVSFFLFCLSLSGVFPLHGFLFRFLPFIRSNRNLHFFIWFAMPFFILFLLTQLQAVFAQGPRRIWQTTAGSVFILAVHGGWYLFLIPRGHVLVSSFVTIGLSCLFFLLLWHNRLPQRHAVFRLALLAVVALQPLAVYRTVVYNSRKGYDALTRNPPGKEASVPEFSFQRPDKGAVNPQNSPGAASDIFHRETSDTSGFLAPQQYYHGLQAGYALAEAVPAELLSSYVRHKFLLYDEISVVAPGQINYDKLAAALRANRNLAYVEALGPGKGPDLKEGRQLGEKNKDKLPLHPQIIDKENPAFQVLDFDVNHLRFRTDLPARKFLVYNDSYHKDWQAFIDGKRVPLYRANAAFKGMWVPAGKHEIFMRFRPLWRYAFMYGLIGLFIFYAGWALICAGKYCLRALLRSQEDQEKEARE